MENISSAIRSIKKSLLKASWWKHVQPEVADKLQFVVDNLKSLGPTFMDAFIASFKYQHAKRMIAGESVSPDLPGALFGRNMTEECYQSGLEPTKHLLGLDDWTKPNDADVHSCMHLCQQIEVLDKAGFFADDQKDQKDQMESSEEKKVEKGLFSDIIRWPLGRKKKDK